MEKIAKTLGVPKEAIKNFSEDAAVNIVANTFTSNDTSISQQYNFNPIEKIVELYNEKIELYERMLQTEKEKNELLKKLFEK